MSRPVYQRASSTNLRPGTAARALEGKLAIVSAFLGKQIPLNHTTLESIGCPSGAKIFNMLLSLLCNMSCLPRGRYTDSNICRSPEGLEVCLKVSTLPEYELKQDLKGLALPLPAI